jgi:surface antigen
MKKQVFGVALALGALFAVSGCETQAGGTAAGAALGAGTGALIGNNVQGINTTQGAIGGAVIGGVLGNREGRQNERIGAIEQGRNMVTVNVTNSNGSVTPVTLERSGNQWRGPRGELYNSVPSESQLRNVYGF